MASREQLHHSSKKSSPSSKSPLAPRLLLAALCIASIFFFLPLLRNDTASQSRSYSVSPNDDCDYTDGRWVYDPSVKSRYDQTCKEIFKGWNCIAGNKSNAVELLKWRWKPYGCDLPQFDPLRFLQSFRDRNIGFIGDSLNRNMFVSLFCSLKVASKEVKKWRPVGADRGFTFVDYNLTIAYHRTNLLARYGRWSSSSTDGKLESLGYKEGYRVDVDIPDGNWADAPSFHDILIFNTGHWWWAPSKFDPVKSPMLFFKKGLPVIPPILPDAGLDMVLSHMVPYVEEKARPGVILLFRTQSPRHFEGGDWYEGGSCLRSQPLGLQKVEELFSIENNGTNVETRLVNQHLDRALKDSRFSLLDITHMSEFRADGHPAKTGGKKHDDCMHWCLPGVTDTWNDLLIAHLSNIRIRNI